MLVPFADFEDEEKDFAYQSGVHLQGAPPNWEEGHLEKASGRRIGFHFEPKTMQLRLPGIE